MFAGLIPTLNIILCTDDNNDIHYYCLNLEKYFHFDVFF